MSRYRHRPGSAQALCELGWLPIDWKTTGCGRTDKGGCGLTGEGRDTDQSSHHAAIFTSMTLVSVSPSGMNVTAAAHRWLSQRREA